MITKKEKNKLFESFVNKIIPPTEQRLRIYRGLLPKKLKVGDIYFNDKTDTLYIFNGKEWKTVA